MTDAELAALEARMIAAAPIVLEATAEVSDDAGDDRMAMSRIPRRMPLPDPAALPRIRPRPHSVCLTARQYSTHHGPSQTQTWAMRRSDFGMSHRARAAHFLGGFQLQRPATGLGSPQVRLQPLVLYVTGRYRTAAID